MSTRNTLLFEAAITNTLPKSDIKQTLQVLRDWQALGQYIAETKLTPSQQRALFLSIEKGLTDNRTGLGKTVDAGKLIGSLPGKLRDAISNMKPVANFDENVKAAQAALMKSLGGESSKVSKIIDGYRTLGNRYPATQFLIWTLITAAVGIGASGPVAAGSVMLAFRTFNNLLKGQAASKALMNALGPAAAASIISYLNKLTGTDDIQPQMRGDVEPGSELPRNPDLSMRIDPERRGDVEPGSEMPRNPDLTMRMDDKTGTGSATQTDYTLRRGDTLSQIARANNISVKDLMDANPTITNPSQIFSGETIKIPSETGNPVYQGGVGTAKDTAAKLASGVYKNRIREAFTRLQFLSHEELFDLTATARKINESQNYNFNLDDLKLSQKGIENIVENVNILAEINWLRNAERGLAKFGRTMGTMGKQFTTKVTAEKLANKYGKIDDSASLYAALQKEGIPTAIIDQVYAKYGFDKSTTATPTPSPTPSVTPSPKITPNTPTPSIGPKPGGKTVPVGAMVSTPKGSFSKTETGWINNATKQPAQGAFPMYLTRWYFAALAKRGLSESKKPHHVKVIFENKKRKIKWL